MWKYPSDIRISENCIDLKMNMVGNRGPRQIYLFLDTGMVRMGTTKTCPRMQNLNFLEGPENTNTSTLYQYTGISSTFVKSMFYWRA